MALAPAISAVATALDMELHGTAASGCRRPTGSAATVARSDQAAYATDAGRWQAPTAPRPIPIGRAIRVEVTEAIVRRGSARRRKDGQREGRQNPCGSYIEPVEWPATARARPDAASLHRARCSQQYPSAHRLSSSCWHSIPVHPTPTAARVGQRATPPSCAATSDAVRTARRHQGRVRRSEN
jgi:hypothetical protein